VAASARANVLLRMTVTRRFAYRFISLRKSRDVSRGVFLLYPQ
jgi:hypothetical protein